MGANGGMRRLYEEQMTSKWVGKAHQYGTARWQRLRLKVIARDGAVCRICGCLTTTGRTGSRSAEVDHIKPHKGSDALFWDEGNLQTLCKACHGSVKARLERGNRLEREDGW